MSRLTLDLPERLSAELAELGRLRKEPPESVAQDMLRRMVAMERFERLANKLQGSLSNDPPLTEEDALKSIS
jgi:hypothetical protein